ncbi:MAG: T9SS type A sorting domain-containing protein [Sphingomonadales bacterium]|nr:T9SS type A sorting domain-containing protein [Sphingomonadales bacterium]
MRKIYFLLLTFSLTSLCNLANSQCLTAVNGQWPDAAYTPTCSGSVEVITSFGWTGEYSVVNVSSGVTYTFSSSVATDFITISNSTGTTSLATGTSSVAWTSNISGSVRFYTHLSSSCNSSTTSRSRRVQCSLPLCSSPVQPTSLTVRNISVNSVDLSFTAASGTPTGYLIVRTTTSSAPTAPVNGTTYTAGASALGGVIVYQGANTSVTSAGLQAGTQYYFWVYSYNSSTSCQLRYNSTTPLTETATTLSCPTFSGTKTVGVGGDFPNLRTAFDQLGACAVSGPLTLSLLSSYSSTNEVFPLVINPIAGSSATNRVTIKPAPGATPIIEVAFTYVLALNGADFITIDGSNTVGGLTRDLTIRNISTSSGLIGIWVASLGAGAGATNNTIANCIIETNTSSFGIFAGLNTGAANGPDNDNLAIRNNIIRKSRYGIQAVGGTVSAQVLDGLVIEDNIFGSALSTGVIGQNAIVTASINNFSISRNTVFGITNTSSFDAISIGSLSTNGVVSSNRISDLINNGTNRASAISLASSSTSNILVSNNFIYNVINNGTGGTTFGCYGLYLSSGGGYAIINNSISLSGNRDAVATTKPSSISSCIFIGSSVTAGVRILNNILSNSQTAATSGPKSYSLYSATSGTTSFSSINSNSYFTSGAQGVLAFLTSDRTTLSAIQSSFGGNQSSINYQPTFVSSTDLHLANGQGINWSLESAGTFTSTVTTDIDGDTRSTTRPDIGADEFSATGFVVNNPAGVCDGNTVDLTAAAVTQGTIAGTTFTYHTNAAGTITLTAPNAVGVGGTYYIKATNGTGNSWVQPVVVTINPLPTPTITGAAAVCAASTGNVYSVTNVTGNTYNWTVTGGTITAGQGTNSITISAGAAGTATVTVTETITATGCVNTATRAVTVNAIPAPVITGQTAACTTTEGNIYSVASVAGNTYAWSVAGGTVTAGPGTNAITVTWGAVGAGTVTVTQTITATGCATTVASAINIQTLPTATSAVVQPITCASEDGQINLTLGGAAGPYTFAWTGTGNGLSATAQNQTTVSTGFYNVVVTAANGCTTSLTNVVVSGPGGCFICPTIGTISATASIICQEGANTISVSGLADLGITYGIRFKYSATPLANPYLSTAGIVMGTIANANLTGNGSGASINYNFPTAGTMYVYAIMSPASPDPACRPFQMIPVVVAAKPALNAPIDQVLCTGSTTTAVSFAATPSATTSFAWTNNRTSIGLAASGAGNSIPAFAATNFSNAPVTATITITPTNTQTLGAATVLCPGPAQTFNYTINPIPTVNTVTDQKICAGTNVSLPFSGFAAGTIFDWTNSNTATGLGASGAGTLSFTATNNTSSPITSTVVVTPRFSNATGFKAFTTPGGAEWCVIDDYNATSGSYRVLIDSREFVGTGVVPSTVNSLALFDLWNGPVTFVSYDPSSWAIYTVTTPTQFNFTSSAFSSNLRRGNGFYAATAEFTFANRSATCSGNPISFDITVNPTPVVNAVPAQVLCSGSATTAISLTSATTGTAFSWTNSATSIGLAGTGTGTSIASFTAVNTGAAPVNAIITVTPSYTGAGFTCSGTAGTTTITVNPVPTATAINNSVICNGAATTYTLTGSATAATYNWTNSNTDIGLAGTGSGTIAFTASNTTASPITSTITVTPSVTNGGLTCTGGTISFTVMVNPSGQVNAIDNQVLCNGSATSAVTFSTTNNGLISTGGTQVAASGTISVAVPDNSPAGVTHTIPVSLPTGAVISNMRVTLNLTHTWIEDMVINLRAPNGQVLNLFNAHGGGGDNLVNTVISSTGTASLASGTAPFTGTYAATAAIGVGPTGNASTAANFAALYSTTNGNWVLALEDEFLGDLGTLTGWSLSFDYTVQGQFGTNMNWTNSLSSIGLAATGTGNIPSFTAANTTAAPVVSTVTVTPVYFNSGTSCPGTPATFTYTVNPTPTVSAIANQVFCAGTPATVSITGATTGTVFNWTNSNAAIGLAASGSGNLSFTPTNTSNVPIVSTIIVTPVYTNGGVTCTVTPRTFTITVNPVGQVNTVLNQVLCNGAGTTAVNFATVNGGGTVQVGTPVTVNSGAITVAVPDASAVGATHSLPVTLPAGATITGVSVNFNMTHTYVGDMVFNLRAPNGQILNLVNRRGGSGDNFTNTTISSASTNSLAGGTAPFTGTFAADAATTGVGPTNFVAAATNFAALYSVANGDWTLGMRDYVGGDVGTLTGWSITFNYTTVAGAVTTYNWTNTTPSIGLAASGVGNIASFAAANTSAVPVTATVSVTPTYTNAGVGCAGPASSFTYTVNPTPTVNAVSNQAVCRGSNVAAISFAGTVSGTVYNWTNTNTAIGLAASGTGDIASFVGTNTTSAAITGTITVTPVFTNAGITCTGTPRTFTITVNPIPTVNAVNSFPVCHNSTAAVTFSGATTGTVYSWTNSTPGIGLAASGTGNISFTALNTTSAPVVATITVTPSFVNGGTTCTGTPITFTITVNPLPVVSAGTLPARICISDTLVPLNGTPVGGSWSGIGTSGMNFVPTATAVGTWPITYTFSDRNGCTNRATIAATVLACEERNRDLDNRAVFLYPNPNNGQFFLRINSTRFNALGMRVFNAAGQLVSTKQWSGLVFARVIPVDLSNLPGGVYMVRLYYGDGMDRGADKTFQIIVTR